MARWSLLLLALAGVAAAASGSREQRAGGIEAKAVWQKIASLDHRVRAIGSTTASSSGELGELTQLPTKRNGNRQLLGAGPDGKVHIGDVPSTAPTTAGSGGGRRLLGAGLAADGTVDLGVAPSASPTGSSGGRRLMGAGPDGRIHLGAMPSSAPTSSRRLLGAGLAADGTVDLGVAPSSAPTPVSGGGRRSSHTASPPVSANRNRDRQSLKTNGQAPAMAPTLHSHVVLDLPQLIQRATGGEHYYERPRRKNWHSKLARCKQDKLRRAQALMAQSDDVTPL
eukprot:TRINITY_DN381_c0_g1_i1.p1 TRINITY_DN381_c0_g1~~TRINITY_DN381_c0_g1_i1.p1  ORF type:complete len:282 (-),score=23.38 TRINITY_DN381_c0_g1_i1:148-993(-)